MGVSRAHRSNSKGGAAAWGAMPVCFLFLFSEELAEKDSSSPPPLQPQPATFAPGSPAAAVRCQGTQVGFSPGSCDCHCCSELVLLGCVSILASIMLGMKLVKLTGNGLRLLTSSGLPSNVTLLSLFDCNFAKSLLSSDAEDAALDEQPLLPESPPHFSSRATHPHPYKHHTVPQPSAPPDTIRGNPPSRVPAVQVGISGRQGAGKAVQGGNESKAWRGFPTPPELPEVFLTCPGSVKRVGPLLGGDEGLLAVQMLKMNAPAAFRQITG